MDLQDISIKWKTIVPIVVVVVLGIVLTMVVTEVRTKDIVVREVTDSTLPDLRDTVINALTTFMIAGNYDTSRKPFLDQMSHIGDVRVVRSPLLDEQFEKHGADEYPADDDEREVLRTGKQDVHIEGNQVHGIFPYVARQSYMGKNCMTCHKVPEGAVLGAVHIRIPLDASFARIHSLQRLYLVLGLGGILTAFAVVFVVFRLTHGPLVKLTDNVRQVINKNLRIRFDHKGRRDEVFVLSGSIEKMIEVFNEALTKIVESASEITSTVDIVKSMSEKTSQGAQTQSRQAAYISKAADQITSHITDIAATANSATTTSEEAMKTAQSGLETADVSIKKINNVFQATVDLATMIEKLNTRVTEIGDVVTVIKDIADQTNLLALNAAIEAARAGDQGRGFAVVADEVRKLAERTIKATDDVSKKIGAVQAESTRTMASMEAASTEVTGTNRQIRQLGEALTSIVLSVTSVRDQVAQIAAAVREQSAATVEVAGHIENTSEISQEIEHASLAVTHEINSLMVIVDNLRQYTADFRTKDARLVILDLAKKDHKIWVSKIHSHITGEITLDPNQLSDHMKCRLGKWYYGDGLKICGDLPSFRSLEEVHKKIHSLGKKIVIGFDAGQKKEAEEMYKELQATSEHVLDILEHIAVEYEKTH